MRVVEIPRAGPPEVMRVRDAADPEGDVAVDVAVDVRACGVNFADLMGRLGIYPDAPPFPFVPGYEVAGVAEGRRVIAVTHFGGYATRVCVPRDRIVDLPDGLSFEEGAAIPVNYLTAWVALMEMARVREGERVLVHSGAGGVGIAAVQIARHAGARVTGVVGTDEKAAFVRGLGAEAVVRPAPPPEADVVLDPRSPSAWSETTARVVVLYGAQTFMGGRASAAWRYLTRKKIDPVRLMNANRGVYGLNMLHVAPDDPRIRRGLDAVLAGVREGWVRPKIAATFPLERAADAHRFLHERRNIGKVVLTTGSP